MLVVVAPMATGLIAWTPMDVIVLVAAGIKVALSALITVVLVKLRVGRHTARWVIHFDDATAVLEDRRDGTAIRLTSANVRNGLHPISVGSDSASLPVVIVETRSGPLVIGPPKGTQVTTEPAEGVGAADVVAPQQAAWDALHTAATHQPH